MKLLILFAIFITGQSLQLKNQECTYNGHSPTGKVLSINIDPLPPGGCDHDWRSAKVCHFTVNTTYNGTVIFHATESSQTATSKAVAKLYTIGDPNFNVEPPNACLGALSCPVTPGSDITYRASVIVPQTVGQNDTPKDDETTRKKRAVALLDEVE